jgi:hypothetical protein
VNSLRSICSGLAPSADHDSEVAIHAASAIMHPCLSVSCQSVSHTAASLSLLLVRANDGTIDRLQLREDVRTGSRHGQARPTLAPLLRRCLRRRRRRWAPRIEAAPGATSAGLRPGAGGGGGIGIGHHY